MRESWNAIVSFVTLEGARLTFENRFSRVNFYMFKVTFAFEDVFVIILDIGLHLTLYLVYIYILVILNLLFFTANALL